MTPISYEQFGRQLIQQAVSPERIRRELVSMFEAPVAGTVRRGKEMLVGEYVFTLDGIELDPIAARLPDVVMRLYIKGRLALSVRIVGVSLRFTLQVTIRLHTIVRTYDPAIIRLETPEIGRDDIDLRVDPHDLRGGLLDKLNIIEPAVRDQIVEEVNLRINSDAVRAAATIDVLELADRVSMGGAAT
ncbi:MAG TPA: hypothetical protein VN046_02820 [Stenotrophobium sp.]|jgi:hypothetical protein|nr:hypothetical protein [Stenotrophobium sp.]